MPWTDNTYRTGTRQIVVLHAALPPLGRARRGARSTVRRRLHGPSDIVTL